MFRRLLFGFLVLLLSASQLCAAENSTMESVDCGSGWVLLHEKDWLVRRKSDGAIMFLSPKVVARGCGGVLTILSKSWEKAEVSVSCVRAISADGGKGDVYVQEIRLICK